MSFADSIQHDWKHWVDREPALLRSLTAVNGVYDTHRLAAGTDQRPAKFRAVNWKEATASAGAYTRQDLVVLVPAAALPDGVTPKAGDQVVREPGDPGEAALTVLEATAGKFRLTYRLVTRNNVLVNGLRSTCDLTRPVAGQDAAGRPALASYSAVASGVPCRVQPVDSDAGEVFDRVAMPTRYVAYLDRTVAVRAHDRLTADGVSYTVTGFRSPETISDLFSISLELIP